MILSDREIRKELEGGNVVVEPLDPEQIQPSSIDLRLGDSIVTPDGSSEGHDTITFPPGNRVILGTTVEYVEIPSHLCGVLHDRSSIARIGLMGQTAGFIDPGFSGELTLELSNLTNEPIELPVGTRVCQMALLKMTSEAECPYGSEGLGSHYQGQKGATSSYMEQKR